MKREDIPLVIDAFRSFKGGEFNHNNDVITLDTSLSEQADVIEKELNEDPDFIAIAWNQTSVNCDIWSNRDYETDLDGDLLPYNILKSDDHWSLFDDF